MDLCVLYFINAECAIIIVQDSQCLMSMLEPQCTLLLILHLHAVLIKWAE